MNETTRRFARLVDLSAVQAHQYRSGRSTPAPSWLPDTTLFPSMCCPAGRVFSTLLPQQERERMIGGPVGFPGGGHATDTKVQEVRQLIADGAREVDMVVNIGKVLSGDYDYVREDLRRVVDAAAPVPAKVILETHYLNEEQIRRVCDIAVEVGMKWVKPHRLGADRRDGGKSQHHCRPARGRIDIKGAGGIRDLETVRALYQLGVRRLA